MTVREQLSKELEQAPDSLVQEILDFCLFIKQRQQAKVNNQSTETKTNGILDLLERVKEIQARACHQLTHLTLVNNYAVQTGLR